MKLYKRNTGIVAALESDDCHSNEKNKTKRNIECE